MMPTAALAETVDFAAQTPPAVEEAADPANGEAKQENQPAEQEEQQETPAVKQDEAVANVQAMIDALPDAAELDGMDDAARDAVQEAFQAACDAYYDTLTEEQQAQLKTRRSWRRCPTGSARLRRWRRRLGIPITPSAAT